MRPDCSNVALTNRISKKSRLIPRVLSARLGVCLALCVLFISLCGPSTGSGLGAVEPKGSGSSSDQTSPGTASGTPSAADTSKPLQEALDRELGITNSPPKGTNAPVQLILAPRPLLEPVNTNNLEDVLSRELKRLATAERRERMVPGSLTNSIAQTNATAQTNGPVFDVKGYELTGNTLLPPDVPPLVLQPYIVTNATFATIRQALADLQKVYSDRGFKTVIVNLPQQTLSNGIVKIQVVEGTVSEINVVGNHHFSSNNVMRALPSLHTNMILNSYLVQSELDRANANQDRQIYPQIEPGADPGTTDLRLQVKDRFPLHTKIELNNQNSPGTPDLRLNGSAVYDNLWQLEHSVGVQYSFSPEDYKTGKQWSFYDEPLVANYSTFYRMPLGNPSSVAEVVAPNVGNFGYDEATRRFNLPPPSGQPELNVYASRSTIDTGVESLLNKLILDTGTNSLRRQDFQQELTVNNDLGSRLTLPLWSRGDFHSTISGGLDYKEYQLSSYKTNIFTLQTIEVDNINGQTQYITNRSTNFSAVPTTIRPLNYVPLSLHLDAGLRDSLGNTAFGLGLSVNSWFSGTVSNLHNVIGSSRASGYWAIVTPSLSRDFVLYTNWTLSTRLDGQLSSEPLPSNEQFGAGGVASVRGYHEGESFGDDGYHAGVELKTPAHVVGFVNAKQGLSIRGSVYMDYARVFVIDPPHSTPLWSTGFGAVASVGARWEARFLFSVPLISTVMTPRDELYFNFAISAQF